MVNSYPELCVSFVPTLIILFEAILKWKWKGLYTVLGSLCEGLVFPLGRAALEGHVGIRIQAEADDALEANV